MVEEWKTINDYPDYTISNYGRVYTSRRNRMLKTSLDSNGYLSVNISNSSSWRRYPIHRLVALNFVDGWFEGAVANHINGIKIDNVAWNLEWITQRDNVRRAFSMGLIPTQHIRIVELDATFRNEVSCARFIDGKPAAILNCLKGNQQTHKGLHFEYTKRVR